MKRLQNAQDLRRYLANLINRTESGEVEVNLGKSLAYMSSILLRIIEGFQIVPVQARPFMPLQIFLRVMAEHDPGFADRMRREPPSVEVLEIGRASCRERV